MAIKPVQELVAEAKADLDNLTPQEAQRRATEDGALLVDIRDVRELQRGGTAVGAMHAPRGMLEFWIDPESPYYNEVFCKDREFIVMCASGWRSALSAKTLLSSLAASRSSVHSASSCCHPQQRCRSRQICCRSTI